MAKKMTKVLARPPRKKIDDKPKGLDDLSNWVDEQMSTPAPPREKKLLKTSVKLKAEPPKKFKLVSKPKKAEEPEEREDNPKRTKGGRKRRQQEKEPLSKIRSRVLSAILEDARAEYGNKNIAAAGDVGNLVIGIPMPLAMQYVLQNNVFPVGRMIQLVGMEKSNKSSLAFEIARWFTESMGMAYLFENETKFSSDLAQSIYGWTDETGIEVMGHWPCETLEDWQQKVQNATMGIKLLMTKGDKERKIKPLGRTLPVLMLLDSIAGGVAEEKQTKITKRGFASRDYSIEALLNQDFLKKYRSDLVGWPFAFLVVNHLKKQKAEGGQYIERKKPGGKHLGFAESIELEMAKIKALRYVDDRPGAMTMDIRGNRIKIECQKSSIGEEDRELTVNFMWWYDKSEITGRPRQYSRWQWEEAVVDLLASQEGSRKQKVTDIVDLRVAKEGRLWSKRLGVSKKAPLPRKDIGMLIEQDPKIISQLQDLFAIKQRTIFQPGDDFKKLVETRAKQREKLLNL